MKKTLSKIKNKPSKGSEQKSNEQEGVNVQTNALEARGTNTHIDDKPLNSKSHKFHIYNVNADSTKRIRGPTRNDLLTERSNTTYEPFTSSTSESDPERKPRRYPRELATKNGKRNKDADPEVCITVPEGGKGNVRIVGNVTEPKQVEFASLDAVYGTISEVSSDEEADVVRPNNNRSLVYRVEGQDYRVLFKGSKENGPSGRRDNEGGPSSPEQDNAQESFRSRIIQGMESDQIDRSSGVQPTLAMPIISLNIQTSKEEMHDDIPNNKINTSSRLFRLKQHLFESGVGGNLGNNHNETLERANMETLANSEQRNEQKGPEKIGHNSKDEPKDLRGVLEQLIMTSKQGNGSYNKNLSQNITTTQTRIELESVESKNKCDDMLRSVNSGLTRPLIYVAKLDNDTLYALGQGTDNKDTNKGNISKVASKSSPSALPLNKSVSKQSSKKRPEVIGSKIGVKKSKRSFLKSSIPKPPSACSRRTSTMSIGKINRSVEGSTSRSSKKYVIRDIMVIPEEQIGQQFADVYPAQPIDYEIPEETVMYAEREIRLHDLNNTSILETDNLTLKPFNNQAESNKFQQITLDRNSPMNLRNNTARESIPCLYYCSTSTIDTGGGTKNNLAAKTMTECRHNQKPVTSDPFLNSNRQQGNVMIDNKSVLSNRDDKLNTILIDSETHKEIMEAIDASNGKERIISLPTKISRKDSASKRLSLGVKRSKGVDSLRTQVSFVETVTEEDTQDNIRNRTVKPIQIMSTDVTDVTGNTETDRSELFEIRRKVDFKADMQPELKNDNPFIGENTSKFLAYPSLAPQNTPLNYNQHANFENDKESPNATKKRKRGGTDKKKLLRHDRRKESKVIGTILSFSEPLISAGSNNDLNVYDKINLNSNEQQAEGRKSKRRSKTSKFLTQTPETMVYVGRLPNTTYNVFFSADRQGDDVRDVHSETRKLSPIKSEKLLAQGPKAILIFVNKKTELNRNPFDGNVVYDDDNGEDHRTRSKGKKDKDDKKGKDKGKDRQKHGKRKHKSDESRSKKSDFDVASVHDPGRSGDEIVVEKSPSGLKTVVKYPCGCMKITRIDPENNSVSEEITSAFCRLGSKCEISQSQKDKRMLRYAGEESRRESSKYRELPRSPQLDIVVEGLLSKKPIKYEPPPQTMKGANLTGTLTIKTNRCNGVFNFYIDPRLKQYLRNNLACITNNRDSYSRSRSS